MGNRKQDELLGEVRYSMLRVSHSGEWYLCFYCGVPADTVDHVPPLSRISDYEFKRLKHERYYKVPCCRECNNLAGASLQDNLVARAEHVKDKLSRKYRKHLMAIEWSEDELQELGAVLESKVRQSIIKHHYVSARIEYYEAIDNFLLCLDLEVSD